LEPPPQPEDRSTLFLTDRELANLPPLEWDIDGVLPAGGLSFLVGLKGAGKTLLAMWFACCIALGREWYGRKVRQGPVVYVAAEGSRSLHSRLDLWKGAHNVENQESGVRWFPHRLPLADAEAVGLFIASVARFQPRLVVIDTLARCSQGTRENDPDGMGRLLESIDRMRETLDCAVLVLAHPPREGSDSPRGHSSQDGAADAIWVLKDQDGARILSCAKMKDGDESLTFGLSLVKMMGSALLVRPDQATVQSRLTAQQRVVLQTIRDVDLGSGVPVSTIVEASKVPRSTVHYVLKHLHEPGFVSVRSHKWSVSPLGLVQLSNGVSNG
jgi:hypothetical protein